MGKVGVANWGTGRGGFEKSFVRDSPGVCRSSSAGVPSFKDAEGRKPAYDMLLGARKTSNPEQVKKWKRAIE